MERTPDIWRRTQPSLFDDFFSDFFSPTLRGGGSQRSSDSRLIPQVSIEDTEEAILLEVEMPGVPKENIRVEVNENILTVSGEKKSRERSSEVERYEEEKFMRSFRLPNTISEDKIETNYENGILEVVL